jgi:hypothetical protein
MELLPQTFRPTADSLWILSLQARTAFVDLTLAALNVHIDGRTDILIDDGGIFQDAICTPQGQPPRLPANPACGTLRYVMDDSSHTRPESAQADVRKETQALWERNRLRCGWFLRDDLVPETRDDLARCLRLMARHGDRATFVLARKLQKCL